MIPKTLHYCWFGRNPLSKSAQKCVDSWRRYCHEYEIVEWNENNFDINMNEYTKKCYFEKKFAFLSDYVRLFVIYNYGGIYLDTDVEIIKSFDNLLTASAFFGFENNYFINTGEGFGAEKKSKIVKMMLDEYNNLLDGTHDYEACPKMNTRAIKKYGFEINGNYQCINGIQLFPIDYFNPLNSNTGKLKITDNTYSIHWYSQSWLSPLDRIRSKTTRPFHRLFGEDCFSCLKNRKSSHAKKIESTDL